MKTAVSIPDDLFGRAERLARKMKLTRSGLFSATLKEYVARHAEDEVTEAVNAALLAIGDQEDDPHALSCAKPPAAPLNERNGSRAR